MQKLTVKLKKDKDHRIYSVSGVWGGVTPQGMVYFDLFLEKPEAPDHTIITVDETTGQKTESVPQTSDPCIERILLAGVTVRPEIARSIGQWLIEKSDEVEMIRRHEGRHDILQ